MEEEVHVYVETPDRALLWKMPSFDVGTDLIDGMIKRAQRARTGDRPEGQPGGPGEGSPPLDRRPLR